MKVKACCPGSCGELIQGIIGNGEKLISLPINIFSKVTIEETKNGNLEKNKTKVIEAIHKTFQYYNEPRKYIDSLSLKIDSQIPIAKGMASSTADIAATIVATSKLLGKKLNNNELASLCCDIEPTDSTIFKNLTLFDHINGEIIQKHPWDFNSKILIMELKGTIDTQEFRKHDYSEIRIKNKKDIEKAYEIFCEAWRNRDKKILGRAITISSIANQNIIYKPMLEKVIEISLRAGAYGVNVAHSGTVIGILYDDNLVDIQRLKSLLSSRDIKEHYIKAYLANVAKGGVRIIKD